MLALLSNVGHFRPPKSEPEDLRDERTAAFLERQQRVAKHPVAGKHIDPACGHLRHHPASVCGPEKLRLPALQRRILTRSAHTDDHVHFRGLQCIEHFDHQTWRFLQVGRHDGEVAAVGLRQPSTHGSEGAEVARQQHKGRFEWLRGQGFAQQVVTSIRAAIDHEHDVESALQFGVQPAQRRQQIRQRGLVLVNGNDETQLAHAAPSWKRRTAAITRPTCSGRMPGKHGRLSTCSQAASVTGSDGAHASSRSTGCR